MWDMNDVTKVEYRGGYVYHIQFDDGAEGEVDFSEYLSLGPIFEALRDRSLFSKATVEGGTITWPNGADVAPETLYEKMVRAEQPLQRTRRRAARR
jgi:hypothetical protein